MTFYNYVVMRRVFSEGSDYYDETDGGVPLGFVDSDEAFVQQLTRDLTCKRLPQVALESFWPYAQENSNPRELSETWALMEAFWRETRVEPEFRDYFDWYDNRWRAPKILPPRYYETMAEEVDELFYYVVKVPIDESPESLRARLLASSEAVKSRWLTPDPEGEVSNEGEESVDDPS